MDESDREYLSDMFRYSTIGSGLLGSVSSEDFAADQQKVLAVFHALQTVGEAANRISASAQNGLPRIPWADVIGMRHRLVHGYREARADIVFKTVREDLPALIASLSQTLENEPG